MRRKFYILASFAALSLTISACGSGGGVVINGTTSHQEGTTTLADGQTSGDGGASIEGGTSADDSNEALVDEGTGSSGGTKIEIFTSDTTAAQTETSTEPSTTEAPTAAPTTAAPTTAAPTTAAKPTTTAAPTTAAKEYTVRDVNKTMYATSSVRVRSSYSTSSEILGSLAVGESVQCTGESDNGWMQVSWKGYTGYVSKSYLSDDPPATTAADTGNDRPTTTQPSGTTPGTTTTPGGNTSTGGNTTPGGNTPTGGNTTPGGNTPTGGNTTPGGNTPAGGTTSPGGGNNTSSGTISGKVINMDPSGVTIQASDGSSHSFVWGSTVTNVAPGDNVQITYSGNTIVSITK